LQIAITLIISLSVLIIEYWVVKPRAEGRVAGRQETARQQDSTEVHPHAEVVPRIPPSANGAAVTTIVDPWSLVSPLLLFPLLGATVGSSLLRIVAALYAEEESGALAELARAFASSDFLFVAVIVMATILGSLLSWVIVDAATRHFSRPVRTAHFRCFVMGMIGVPLTLTVVPLAVATLLFGLFIITEANRDKSKPSKSSGTDPDA